MLILNRGDVTLIIMIHYVTFKSAKANGPRLLVFGSVHGNEICGPTAINQWIQRFQSGACVLEKGSVTFVPVCNPEAYAQNKRMIDVNLNRVYIKNSNPQKYEEKLAQELMGLIDAHDSLLDLHSVHRPSQPFVFQDNDKPETVAMAAASGLKNIVVGWNNVFPQGSFCSGCSYALSQGKPAIVVECGQHIEPNAIDVAERAIGNILVHFNLIAQEFATHTKPIYFVLEGFAKRAQGESLAKRWNGFDLIKKDEEIVVGGAKAPRDSRILMCDPDAPVGEEWYYLLKEIPHGSDV